MGKKTFMMSQSQRLELSVVYLADFIGIVMITSTVITFLLKTPQKRLWVIRS